MKIFIYMCFGCFLFASLSYAGNGYLIVDGKLGVGTTPARQFEIHHDVSGVSIETGSGSPNASVFRFGDNTGWKMHFGRSRESSGGVHNYGTDGLIMTLQDNGNVGIGTINPTVRLDVMGANSLITQRIAGASGKLNTFGYYDNTYGVLMEAVDNASVPINLSYRAANHLFYAGNVGIGTTAPSQKLDVAGNIALSGTVIQTSDAKFKKNLLPITNPLDKIVNLQGLSYDWKVDEYKEKGFLSGRHYGVIAQEIEKVLPEVVNTDSKGEKSVAYAEIIPVLIEAIKEQQKIIQKQDKRISELEELSSKLKK